MDFYKLEPDFILRHVETLGFACSGHIQQLNSLENRVFDLKLEDSSHVIVKFYRPGRWNKAAVGEEHNMLFSLRDAEVPVCAPLRPGGESIFCADDIFYAIWPRTGGRLIDEFTPQLVKRLGGYIARIHNATLGLKFKHRPVMDRKYMIDRHKILISEKKLLPPKHRDAYFDHCEFLAQALSTMNKQCGYQAVHGDCHTGNILMGDHGLFFLDFDDTLSAPPVQDMWMIVSDSPQRQREKAALFIEGYEQFRSFPSDSLRFIELLRALRFVAYNGWIARRRTDPAILRAFPDFGTHGFWDEFMQDLHDQIQLIRETNAWLPAESAIVPEVGTSTDEWNDEDYFFDLDNGRWSPGE